MRSTKLREAHGVARGLGEVAAERDGHRSADELCDPFYQKMKELGLILLSHVVKRKP